MRCTLRETFARASVRFSPRGAGGARPPAGAPAPAPRRRRPRVEDEDVRLDLTQPGDREAGRVLLRVATGGEDHAHAGLLRPLDLQLVEAVVDDGEADLQEVGLEAGQEH